MTMTGEFPLSGRTTSAEDEQQQVKKLKLAWNYRKDDNIMYYENVCLFQNRNQEFLLNISRGFLHCMYFVNSI